MSLPPHFDGASLGKVIRSLLVGSVMELHSRREPRGVDGRTNSASLCAKAKEPKMGFRRRRRWRRNVYLNKPEGSSPPSDTARV